MSATKLRPSRKLREQVKARRRPPKDDFCAYAEQIAGEAEDSLSEVEHELREEIQELRGELQVTEERLEGRIDDIESEQ